MKKIVLIGLIFLVGYMQVNASPGKSAGDAGHPTSTHKYTYE